MLKRTDTPLIFAAVAISATIFVQILVAPFQYASVESGNREPEKVSASGAEQEIAYYTYLLAFFTAALVVVSAFQIYFLRRADETARITAEAAKESADALPLIERAYIYAKVEMSGPMVRSVLGHQIIHFRIRFTNHGRTPATVVRMRRYAIVLPIPPTELPGEEQEGAPLPDGMVIGANESEEFGGINFAKIPDFVPTDRVFCCGMIVYRDVLGKERTTGFCWEALWHSDSTTTAIAQSPLNYTG